MDELHIPYSLKAIAYPPRNLYQKLLIKSVVSAFITNLRWKVISILRPFKNNKHIRFQKLLQPNFCS